RDQGDGKQSRERMLAFGGGRATDDHRRHGGDRHAQALEQHVDEHQRRPEVVQQPLGIHRGRLSAYAGRRGTTRLPTETCTASPFWLRVVVRTLMSPWFGRDFDGRTSSTSASTVSSSPGRTGSGQRNSSKPAPTMPPAGLKSLSTRSRMVTAAVCQPLAASPPKIVSRAASSSRWNGCGSNSAAKALIRSLSIGSGPERKVCPTAKSSRYRPVTAPLRAST